ncbi:hypothetical protein [Krasilnikovia sp. MM14-A1259]|uniref:hypothetical protein n=1 Tax=Krasilnikovia sp. MM14-A1259 TaxID=3373539 RepID=UPI0038072BD9
MSSLLEDRYRQVLRLLPADYRQAWEEDMVASFLEAAHTAAPDDPEGVEISRPTLAETASIAALAVRLRLGGAGAAPRPFAWGEAVRRFALVGLLAHAIGGLFGIVLAFWTVEQLPGAMPLTDTQPLFPSRWVALWSLSGLLWLPAYLAAVHGRHRAARVIAAVAFLPGLVGAIGRMTGDTSGVDIPQRVSWLVFDLLPVLALVAFGPDSPPMRARPWHLALPAGVALTVAVLLAADPRLGQDVHLLPLVDWPGLWCAGLLGLAVAHWSIERTRRSPVWPLTLVLLVAPVLVLRLVTLIDYVRFAASTDDATVPASIGTIQCVVLLAIGAAMAGVAARRLRAETLTAG